MFNEFLNYYNLELSSLRKLGFEFAKEYPHIAARLGLSAEFATDPHVEKLIESVAFLTGQIRQKIDDEFPEIIEALLAIFYPHYLVPLPSCSIVCFKPKEELNNAYLLPRDTLIESNPKYGEKCTFNTVYPTPVLPVQIQSISLKELPLNLPMPAAISKKVQSVLAIELVGISEKVNFKQLCPKQLRFYINSNLQAQYLLHELILHHTLCIGWQQADNPQDLLFLSPASHLKSVGFDEHENVLPYASSISNSQRIVMEYFTYLEKFFFIDLVNLNRDYYSNANQKIIIYLYLDNYYEQLQKSITDDVLMLGCSPIVNLFKRMAEPISVDYQQPHYPIIADAHRVDTFEIYAIESVSGMSNLGVRSNFLPLYGTQHPDSVDNPVGYWYATRQLNTQSDYAVTNNSTLLLSITNSNFDKVNVDSWTINIATLCTNGLHAQQLPFGNNSSILQFSLINAPVSVIECLLPMSYAHPPREKSTVRWQLLSLLALNKLSICDQKMGAEVLKEILRLHNIKNNDHINQIIESILEVQTQRITARETHCKRQALCRGLEIQVTIDASHQVSNGLYLFLLVLENYFAEYASINSFAKLKVISKQSLGVIYEWPPRSGQKHLQ